MDNFNIAEWDIVSKENVDAMQFDSGVLVKNFNTSTFEIPTELIFATSGDININYQPTFANLGDDVNNIHRKYAEFEVITGTNAANITVTVLDFSPATLKTMLGAADITDDNHVSPRLVVKDADFENIAWVGKKIGGGLLAVVIPKALCTSGLAFSAKKGGKGSTSMTIEAFATLTDKTKAEMEFYSTQSAS